MTGGAEAVAASRGEGSRRRILVVDDQDENRRILERVLRELGYETESARDGVEALAKLPLDIELVMLDADMPTMDGFEVARRIRAAPQWLNLPIIMVTGLAGKDHRLRAVEAGINDFITKPFDIAEVRLRCRWLLKLKDAHDELERHKTQLERLVEKRTAALRDALEDMANAQRSTYAAHVDTIRRLVLAAEYKDRDTAAHIERIGRYSEVLARGLGLAPQQVEILRHAAPMHDVGKIGIPDAILLKPGKLTDEEWEIMKRHSEIGARMLAGSASELLQAGERIARSHHERWDGKGYPHGTAGAEIPLGGRICAVVDFFDALTMHRRYRDALPKDTVYEMMRDQRGKHFDPDVLDLFFDRLPEIEVIQGAVPD